MAEFEVLRGASASALRVRLQGNAAVSAESDALVSKTHNVEAPKSTISCAKQCNVLAAAKHRACRAFLWRCVQAWVLVAWVACSVGQHGVF